MYGMSQYGPQIDIWSIGCIFAELMMRKALFSGTSDIDQLTRIIEVLGAPTVCFLLTSNRKRPGLESQPYPTTYP